MRHRKSFNHLGRKSAHRKAMLANMAASLVLHKRITTTTAKAKALRMYVEPLITKAKDDSTHSRRVVFSYLQNKEAVTELFREVSGKVADRPGGYTRILKTGTRLGDNADMCIIELVDYNENLLAAKEETTKKSTRRRRGGKKTTAQATEQTEAVVAEETIEEETEEVKTEEAVVVEEPKAEVEVKEEAKVETEVKAEEPKAEEKKEEKKEEPKAKAEKVEAKEVKPARPAGEKEEETPAKEEDKEEEK